MNSYINSFGEYLNYELNYSDKTCKTYTQALKEYEQFLEDNHYCFLKINADIANGYKAYLINQAYESKTASLYLSAVRTFYNYLVEIKEIDNNPFLTIKNPKVVKKLPNFLNHSEVKNMFGDLKEKSDLDVRNDFIVEFLYASGLRVSELCNIKLSDIYFAEQKIKVMGKGSKERMVFYKACDSTLFNYYLQKVRPRILGKVKSEYLLVSKTGRLTPRSVEKIVQKLALKKDIKSKYIRSFLYYLPYSVLAVMVFPTILFCTSSIWSGLAGTAVALLLAFFRKGLLPVSLAAIATVFAV